jgi:hypothetical protein
VSSFCLVVSIKLIEYLFVAKRGLWPLRGENAQKLKLSTVGPTLDVRCFSC